MKVDQQSGYNQMQWPGGTLCLYASGEVDFQIFNAFDQSRSEPVFSYKMIDRADEINEDEIQRLLKDVQKYKGNLLEG